MSPAESDQVLANQSRASEWAVRAVKAGGLVTKPRGRSAAALATYERDVEVSARQLVLRVVQPGEWFLVLWGGTRKGSGTFYTRPQLAVPTVQRTIRHLAYEAPAAGDDAPLAEWTPKAPETILSLKICDPATGSGSFPVAALRFLTDALWRSLLHHRWLIEEGDRFVVEARGTEPPPWFAESVRDLPVTSGDAETHVRARLRRVIVERCIYGVDFDPLAIELARLSIWVETMDRTLPFEFLDHRIKVGNALVGCWFDRFRDYPVMAWMREGGDKNHTNFVHHYREKRGRAGAMATRSGDKWTNDIKDWRDKRVKPDLANWIVGQGSLIDTIGGRAPEAVHDAAVALLARMEEIPIQEPEERARFYRDELMGDESFQRLKQAFDTWCALWFWPADKLSAAPLASTFSSQDAETSNVIAQLRGRLRFFHWELEFPDVFIGAASGFDAVIGNPPWEIQKPNSKEFFSNIDPLYRSYGKQEAVRKQKEYFEREAGTETEWVAYAAHYKALSNWNKLVATPFGDPDEGEPFALERGGDKLHQRWRGKRKNGTSYGDPNHPFRRQGSADINTYKMFLEQAHSLLKPGGKLGMIVPSGVYTDKGSSTLRELFLEHCRWEWLFGFENRHKIFDIDSRFKFCPIIVSKGGRTEAIRAAFMRHDLRDWDEGERHIVFYPRSQVTRFSPNTRAILEVRDRRDLEVLEKIYANSVLLGDSGPDGWGITYAREFDMTNDSKLFPPRPHWEAQGYRPDEYGRWLKFRESQPVERHPNQIGWIRLADGSAVVHEDAIEDIALPLYEGRMIGQFDFSDKGWVSGKGRSAEWRDIPWDAKAVQPQYLMSSSDYDQAAAESRDSEGVVRGLKLAFMAIGSATNRRSMFSALINDMPCGNSVPAIQCAERDRTLAMALWLNSFAYDFTLRARLGGININYFVISETPLLIGLRERAVLTLASRLSFAHPVFAAWQLFFGTAGERWALANAERVRCRAIADAMAFALAGLDFADATWILRDCDQPRDALSGGASRLLDPKGFWRAERELDPELRHSVLSLVAFQDLLNWLTGDSTRSLEDWFTTNDGEGWNLPESLCLADYGLGHDTRAKQPQLVRRRLGERFYPWQVAQSPEQTRAECERHARNILGAESYGRLKADIAPTEVPRLANTATSCGRVSGVAGRPTEFVVSPKLFDEDEDEPQ